MEQTNSAQLLKNLTKTLRNQFHMNLYQGTTFIGFWIIEFALIDGKFVAIINSELKGTFYFEMDKGDLLIHINFNDGDRDYCLHFNPNHGNCQVVVRIIENGETKFVKAVGSFENYSDMYSKDFDQFDILEHVPANVNTSVFEIRV